MENQENKNQNNNQNLNSKDNKRQPRKSTDEGPKFNYFWVYAIVILFILITSNLSFFQENQKETDLSHLEHMLKSNDVDKVIIVNQKWAEVFIKDSAISKPDYKEVAHNRFNSPNKGPHFRLTVASNDAIDRFFTQFYKDNPTAQQVIVPYEARQA